MKSKSLAIAMAMSAAALAGAYPALAQAATAAAATPTLSGPAIPGMCIISNDYLFGASALGKYIFNRLGQLKAQVDAELNSQGTTLQTDIKALQAQRNSLTEEQFGQRAAPLQQREQDLQRLAQQRGREMQATQEKAMGYLAQQAEPIVRQVVVQRNCSILMNGSAVVVAEPGMDISPAVVQQLDSKVQSYEFDREHIDPSAAAQ